MKIRKRFALFLCAALAAGLLAAGCSEEPPESGAEGEETALGSLRSFSAGTLDGGTFTQDDIAAKDVTVLNFWALSCGPCIVEMPDLAEFARSLPDNVQLVTVCLDAGGNEDAAREVLTKAGFEGVTLISGSGDLLDLSRNLMYTPTTVFADSEGNLVGDAVTGRQEDLSGTLLAAVNAVLEAGGKAAISLAE